MNLDVPIPARIDALPKCPVRKVPVPVPWFVAWIDGKPEFRVADGAKFKLAVEQALCWAITYLTHRKPLGCRLFRLFGS